MSTGRNAEDIARRLASVRGRLEATLQEPTSAVTGALVGLEADVAAVCSAVPNLPAADAHALAPEMKHVIGLLELLSKAISEQAAAEPQNSDSAALRRQAAAAYGGGQKRRR
ncbi:hypothetical protein NUH88_02010 [Nisaea acidiphila]|uniref:Uncharacterized protein n=1 Tax=Nisaea acidiphila TaxID=1862145 RepID=A0A9J7AVI0_9PROT|nr:hypothetical protein [Nisaea acidiphila]UUX50473.1 hypothetical protein NUH88_02010 [Nisaea acidiphila]